MKTGSDFTQISTNPMLVLHDVSRKIDFSAINDRDIEIPLNWLTVCVVNMDFAIDF